MQICKKQCSFLSYIFCLLNGGLFKTGETPGLQTLQFNLFYFFFYFGSGGGGGGGGKGRVAGGERSSLDFSDRFVCPRVLPTLYQHSANTANSRFV